ncbi:MAG: hypothetical protein ACREP3_19015 [Candidatus Binatia bacterium]
MKLDAMASSPFLFHTGLGVITALAFLLLAASVLTLIVSTILLWLYRRAVARLMSAQAGQPELRTAAGAPSDPVSAPARQDCDPVAFSGEDYLADRVYHLTISQPRRHARKYAVAGALFALLMGLAAFLAFSQTQMTYLRAAAHPRQFFFMFWTFVWPIVLTTNIVAAASRRSQCVTTGIYFAVLVVLAGFVVLISTESPIQVGSLSLPAWSGETPLRLAGRWILFNLAPTLMIVTFRNRRLRAVAPVVLSFMTVISAGLLSMITAAFLYQDLSVAAIDFAAETLGVSVLAALIGYFLLLGVVACILSGVIGWWLLLWIRSGYRRKIVSDQSLAIDTLWLIFGSFYAVILAFAGPAWALSAPLAFFIFKIAVSVGNKRLLPGDDRVRYAPALLVLRVFSLGKRSEILFDAVTKRWRYVGNVRLIAGTDLAFATVAPHQFLAFVSGGLSGLFIRDETAVDRIPAEMDTRRDRDGRFRLNDLFCHADTWQRVLSMLVKSTDVVLMDLRSFAANNAGCVFEIKELLNTVPLQRLVFVVDATTDKSFLQHTFEESCGALRSDSPNLGCSSSTVQPFALGSLAHDELQRLMSRLCTAVGSAA